MSIEIKEVTNKKLFNAFLDLPYRLYKDHKYHVPPLRFDEAATLNKDKNPAFDYCESKYWLAYKDGKVVGRIAGILNKEYVEKWKNKYVRFGWIDFENDIEIAKALIGKVEDWAKEMGMTAVHGPLGFTDLDHEGMLVDGFDQLGTLASLYNHSYYPEIIQKLGYVKDADWVEYRINLPATIPEKLEKLASIVERRLGLKVIKAKKPKEILPYAKPIFDLINSEYSGLYGVTSLTDKQIAYYTKQYFGFMRTDFVSLIVDSEGKLAAFGITMPSLSLALQKAKGKLLPFGVFHILKAMKKNDTVDFLMIAIRKDLQGKGVNAILMHEMAKSYIKNGIKFAETNHELEDNTKVQSIWKDFDAKLHKRRRCFIKHLL
jgi:GNAT superfamily N-acetyltransferase